MKLIKKGIRLFALIIALGCSTNAFSVGAPGGPGSGSGSPPCWPPPCVPIDGGISFLLLAGAAYGGKKIYDLNNEKKAD